MTEFRGQNLKIDKALSERGFALLIVAISLAALSLIYAAALSTARQELDVTSLEAVRARLLASADGAIATAEYELVSARAIPPQILSAPETVTIGEVTVRVSARPESSKLDLNAANPQDLQRYFVLSGLNTASASNVVRQIMERRRVSSTWTSASRYENRSNRYFQSVSELGGLRGASRDLVDCAEPDLTVFTRTSFVDPDQASGRVRAAIGLSQADRPRAIIPVVTSQRAIIAGEVFEIVARVSDDAAGVHVSRETMVRITGNIRKPVWTLLQTSPAPDPALAQDACDRLAQKASSDSKP